MKKADSVMMGINASDICHATVPLMLVLNKDDNLIDSIIQCASRLKIQSAALSGIGALKNPTLGFYKTDEKQYQYQQFLGDYELVSLNGNITKHENNYMVHIHVVLGDDRYTTIAGHLKEALIAVTGEITITPFEKPIIRKWSDEFNVCLID